MLCIIETCHSYGDREDDYYEEDDLIEKLIKKLGNLNEGEHNNEETIRHKCKKFISEHFPITRCHSTLEKHYLEALINKVQALRVHITCEYTQQCEWRGGVVRNRNYK